MSKQSKRSTAASISPSVAVGCSARQAASTGATDAHSAMGHLQVQDDRSLLRSYTLLPQKSVAHPQHRLAARSVARRETFAC